jgi:hypothetical protein
MDTESTSFVTIQSPAIIVSTLCVGTIGDLNNYLDWAFSQLLSIVIEMQWRIAYAPQAEFN